MSRKVMQIGYEPERDRLTWDGWDIHCGQGLEVLLPSPLSTTLMGGICLGSLGCLR